MKARMIVGMSPEAFHSRFRPVGSNMVGTLSEGGAP